MKDCFSNFVKNQYLSVSGGLTDCLYSSFCLHPHSNGETRPPDCNSCFNYWLVVKAKLRLCKRTSGSFRLAKVYLLLSDYLTRSLPQKHWISPDLAQPGQMLKWWLRECDFLSTPEVQRTLLIEIVINWLCGDKGNCTFIISNRLRGLSEGQIMTLYIHQPWPECKQLVLVGAHSMRPSLRPSQGRIIHKRWDVNL